MAPRNTLSSAMTNLDTHPFELAQTTLLPMYRESLLELDLHEIVVDSSHMGLPRRLIWGR